MIEAYADKPEKRVGDAILFWMTVETGKPRHISLSQGEFDYSTLHDYVAVICDKTGKTRDERLRRSGSTSIHAAFFDRDSKKLGEYTRLHVLDEIEKYKAGSDGFPGGPFGRMFPGSWNELPYILGCEGGRKKR
ncbi:hypothetical protein [Propionivibrio sp.]|uniref:hypothetical protein n=1 Tax=Propionivibrio sp. TaxID=2212460 RepID=UPI00272EA8C9|nr:hypothetical protein [Propionivibrio sp.]